MKLDLNEDLQSCGFDWYFQQFKLSGKRLRLSALPLLFLLTACSTVDLAQPVNPPDPANAKVVGSLKTVATEAKLEPPLEISAPMDASAVSSARWIICLRSGASDESKRLTYSVFFKDDDYVSSRISAVMEPCAAQAFTALN